VKPPRTDAFAPLDVVVSHENYLPSNAAATLRLDEQGVVGFMVVASWRAVHDGGRTTYHYTLRAERLLKP